MGISRSLSCCLRCPLAAAYLSVTRSLWHLSIHLDPCQSVCLSNYPLAWQSLPDSGPFQADVSPPSAALHPHTDAFMSIPDTGAKPRSHTSQSNVLWTGRECSARLWDADASNGNAGKPGWSREMPGLAWKGLSAGCSLCWGACPCHGVCACHTLRLLTDAPSHPWEAIPEASPSAGTAMGSAGAGGSLCPRRCNGVSLFAELGRFPLPMAMATEEQISSVCIFRAGGGPYAQDAPDKISHHNHNQVCRCAGGRAAWQTSLIIMKLSMCTAVFQQLCLAQHAGNGACYSHPPLPTGSSLPGGSASFGPSEGKGA